MSCQGVSTRSGPANVPFAGQTGFGQSSGPANVPFAGQTGFGQSSGPANVPFTGQTFFFAAVVGIKRNKCYICML